MTEILECISCGKAGTSYDVDFDGELDTIIVCDDCYNKVFLEDDEEIEEE